MAQATNTLLNWYRRYKVRAIDLTLLQDEIYAQIAGCMEKFKGVLSGFTITDVSATTFTLSSGIAIGPSGELLVTTAPTVVPVTKPTGSDFYLALCVIKRATAGSDPITNPVSPFNSVNRKTLRTATIQMKNGVLNGAYPAAAADETILFGAIITAAGMGDGSFALADTPEKTMGLNSVYQHIVGVSSRMCNRSTLAEAVAAASEGDRILVWDNFYDLATAVTINKKNLVIEWRPGRSITKGASATGLILDNEGITLVRPRFENYSGATHWPIKLTALAKYCSVEQPRFKNCANQIDDTLAPDGVYVTNPTAEA